ncbi:MAG TPA: metal ABC transporter ATP-binding protein [Candidatus Saccharimonadales bacterium]|nr:metal ABC transporter ATP-binding protein [Candidatus Saccharimonadales bacterium]
MSAAAEPIAELRRATLRFGERTLWRRMDISIRPSEFLAVLGPNGVGKSSLLQVLLGVNQLSAGSARVAGEPVRRGNSLIGYIPQQKAFDAHLPLRGTDLVGLGLDGQRWGLPTVAPGARMRIARAIQRVGAERYADRPIGKLSGGEQQRLRIAQALVGEPRLLLCDEPLLSLDVASQHTISSLLDNERRRGAAVVFVTHEINPVLPYVDCVLYIVGGKWKLGTPDEVLTSSVLTQLYGTPVEVLRARGRIIVVSDALPTEPTDAHHHLQNGAVR